MRWALIGASTIAAEHMIGAIQAKGGEIIHLVSGSAEHAANFANAYAIPNHGTDLNKAVSDTSVDAVYISSTNEKHFAQAQAAIAAGKHVLCEKPLAMTVDQAVQMVRAAEAKGVIFGTNHHLRCAGSHQAIRALIHDEGRIGNILSIRLFHAVHLPEHLRGWRINDASAGGGAILDITVHDADVVRFLTGEDPVDVVAQAGSSGMGTGVEDSAMSSWRMPSGVMVQSHESFTHPFSGTGLEIHGTKGSIFASGVMTQKPIGNIHLVTEEGKETISFSNHNLYHYGVGRFVNAVAGEGTPAATGWDGVKSFAIAYAVREAALTGQRITLNYEGFGE